MTTDVQFPTIIIRRDRERMDRERWNTYESLYLLDEFRQKGAPFVGNLIFQGITAGELCIRLDRNRDQYVYEWTPPRGWVPPNYDPVLDGPMPLAEFPDAHSDL